jgi:hypothetical protein
MDIQFHALYRQDPESLTSQDPHTQQVLSFSVGKGPKVNRNREQLFKPLALIGTFKLPNTQSIRYIQ